MAKEPIEVPHRSSEPTRQREGADDDPGTQKAADGSAQTTPEAADGTARRGTGEQDRAGNVHRSDHGGGHGNHGKRLKARDTPGALSEAIEALGRDIAHRAAWRARGRGASAGARARAHWEAWARRTGHAQVARASARAAPHLTEWPTDLEGACAKEILEAVREGCALEAGSGAASPAQGLSARGGDSAVRAVARAQLDALADAGEQRTVCAGLAQVRERLRREGAPQAWTIPIHRLRALAGIGHEGWNILAQTPAWFARAVLVELDATALAEPPQQWLGLLCARDARAIGQNAARVIEGALWSALAHWRWRTSRPPLAVLAVLVGTGQWEGGGDEAWGAALATEERERKHAAAHGGAPHTESDARTLHRQWQARKGQIREEVEHTIERKAERVMAEWARRAGTTERETGGDGRALLAHGRTHWRNDPVLGAGARSEATLEEHHAETVWVAEPTSAARSIVSSHLDSGQEDNAAWRPRAIAVRARTPGSEQIGMVQAGGSEMDEERTEALRAFARAARRRARQGA